MSQTPRPMPGPADSAPIRLSRPFLPPEDLRREPKRGPIAQAGDPGGVPPAPPRPARALPAGIEPMLSLNDLAAWLNCSRRILERMRSAGKVPRPDFQLGKGPRWKRSTIEAWIERGGK